MFYYVLFIALLCSLFMIFFEDFKYREVNIVYFIIFFLSSVGFFILKKGSITDLVVNILFLLGNILVLKFYFAAKKKPLEKDLIYGGMAIGDVCFLFIISFLFSSINYIYFYVIGTLSSLVIHLIVSYFNKNKMVPLAGYMSLCLIVLMLSSFVFDFNVLW